MLHCLGAEACVPFEFFIYLFFLLLAAFIPQCVSFGTVWQTIAVTSDIYRSQKQINRFIRI